jgi:hypothetical protein
LLLAGSVTGGAAGEVWEREREREREREWGGWGRASSKAVVGMHPRMRVQGASLQNAAGFAAHTGAAIMWGARAKCRCNRGCNICWRQCYVLGICKRLHVELVNFILAILSFGTTLAQVYVRTNFFY